MSQIQKTLTEIGEKIETSKNKLANYEGREQELMKSLKELLGVRTVEEAEDKIKEMNEEVEDLEKDLEKGMKRLEKEYGWET